jgi:hypothetical protein
VSLKADGCQLSTSSIPPSHFLRSPPIKAPRRRLCNPITCWPFECVGIWSACMHLWSDRPQFLLARRCAGVAERTARYFQLGPGARQGCKGKRPTGLPHHLEKADVSPDQSFLSHIQISCETPVSFIQAHPALSYIRGVRNAQVHDTSNNQEITTAHDKDWRREVPQPIEAALRIDRPAREGASSECPMVVMK